MICVLGRIHSDGVSWNFSWLAVTGVSRFLSHARFHLLPRNPKDGKEDVRREPHIDVSVGDYEGRTDCRKPASFAVTLY